MCVNIFLQAPMTHLTSCEILSLKLFREVLNSIIVDKGTESERLSSFIL